MKRKRKERKRVETNEWRYSRQASYLMQMTQNLPELAPAMITSYILKFTGKLKHRMFRSAAVLSTLFPEEEVSKPQICNPEFYH